MISIKRYTKDDFDVWNNFVKISKNSFFMFDRNYMDYHSDRFIDHSLLFWDEDNKLIAVLPMSEKDDTFLSHGGLTYGGFITDSRMKQHIMNDCFDLLIEYGRKMGKKSIIYKSIPHIYHKQAAEEDRFCLFKNGAELVTIDVSTYINLKDPLKMPKGRKAQISRAKREGVEIREACSLKDYEEFIELENQVLQERHAVKAVHTGAELKMLHDRFPEGIHLFGAYKEGILIAGTVVYEYDNVVHTQYMAANEIARTIGALDLAISTIIEKYRTNKTWLDFGISTEHGRIYLNEGLCAQKEGFGGRTGVYEIWKLDIG